MTATNMNDIENIKGRFDFDLPSDYLRFWESGILTNDIATGLNMSRFWWLAPNEIVTCSWSDYKIRQLIPFAKTPAPDHYCWYVQPGGNVFIADCPRDSNIATVCAPHFEGFIFRSLLEEFADCWQANRSLISNPVDLSHLAREYSLRVSGLLRLKWVEVLGKYAAQPLRMGPTGGPQLLSWAEASRVIEQELAFPMLDKEFTQHDYSHSKDVK
jgi:hypothetical protein